MLHIKGEWEDFYPNTEPQVTVSDGSRSVNDVSISRYFVKLCLFEELKNSSIYYSSSKDSTQFLTEDTSFSECSSSSDGGSINFGTSGQFAQKRVCSYRSQTSSKGVFCYIIVSYTNKNNLYDSSISFSGAETQKGIHNIFMAGSVNISNVNESFTTIDGRCLFDFQYIKSKSIIVDSTFSNNSQISTDTYVSGYLNGKTMTPLKIKICNFLNNLGSQHADSVLLCSQCIDTVISNSSFIGNTRNIYRFEIYDKGNFRIEYCYIADEQPDKNNPIVTNTIADKSTVLLSHFSTFQCQAVFPLSYTIKNIGNKTYINFLLQIFNKVVAAAIEVYLSHS